MRNSRRLRLCSRTAASALAFLAALAPQSALPADSARGAKLAKQWCASCHVVSGDQARAADVAPTFASIAERPGFSANHVTQFLLRSHPRMPGVHLSRDEARDLGAYIATLAH